MEKQGLRFFILHALARQLQGWADLVFKQVGEEGRSAQGSQANTEKAERDSGPEVSGVTAAPVVVAQPPTLEEEGNSADADGPPAHWLARVQKAAPDLLKQKGYAARPIATPSHTVSAAQADGSIQTADAEQRARTTEIMWTERKDRSAQGNQAKAERADTGEATEVSRTAAAAVPAAQPPGLVARFQGVSAVDIQAAAQMPALKEERDSATEVSRTETAAVPAVQLPALEEGRGSGDADSPPAHWLARVQKAAPDLLNQKEYAARSIAAPFHMLPAAQTNGGTQKADTDAGQHSRATEIVREEMYPIRPTETGKPRGEEGRVRWEETDVSASPDALVKQNVTATMGQGKEPVRTSEPDLPPLSLPGEWRSRLVQPDSSPWEERLVMRSHQQARHNLRPQMSISAPAHDHRSLGEAREQIQIEMRWPSLPDEVIPNSQDWEMAWRAWERQQRLNEEQRGSSWNA